MVASMTVGLIGVVSLVVIVFSLLWEAYEENQRRVQAWLERAQSAENAQGRAEECLHQVRGSVAAVARGIEVLGRYGDDASDSQRSRLATMIDREVERLGRLVSREAIPGGDRVELVPLDDVIHSTLRLMRVIDRTLEWNPSGQWVTCDWQATSEILRILLENAQRHAPGTAVVVSTSSSDMRGVSRGDRRRPAGSPASWATRSSRSMCGPPTPSGKVSGSTSRAVWRERRVETWCSCPTTERGASFSLNLPLARIIDLPLTEAGLAGRMTRANGASRVAIVEDNGLLAESLAMALAAPRPRPSRRPPQRGRRRGPSGSSPDARTAHHPAGPPPRAGGRWAATRRSVDVPRGSASSCSRPPATTVRHGSVLRRRRPRPCWTSASSLDSILSVLRALGHGAPGLEPAHTPDG